VAYAPILKPTDGWTVVPNLVDYEGERAGDFWARARADLDGLPDGGLNIAHEAVDRHVAAGRGDKLALRWLGKRGGVRDFTFADLHVLTNRFANALDTLGVEPGDLVSSLAGRIPELYVTALGTLKHRSVFSPLFSAFGPEPIRTRLTLGKAKVLVTTEALYRRKVAATRSPTSSTSS
jgi:acetyl-CoA synthetase